MTQRPAAPSPHGSILFAVATVTFVTLVVGGLSMFRTAAQQPAGDVDPRAFRQSMFEAEDSRAADPAGLATLLAGVESPDPEIRRLAVRALGRLERAELAGRIAQLVDADQPTLRAEAVNALGQSLQRGGALSPHVATLRARLDAETDPDVRGVVAAALGRLPYQDVLEVGRVEAALRPLAGSTEPSIALGAVNGLESLARLQRDRAPLRDETLDALRAAARTVGDGETTRRVRRLALSALIAAGAIDAPAIDLALEDGDPQVRRLAALALVSTEVSERAALVARAMTDQSAMVRYEALRAYGERGRANGCAPLMSAVEDPSPHVAQLALDLLGDGCPAGGSPVSLVARIAGQLVDPGPSDAPAWHRPAHAFVSLASLDPDRAAPLLPRFVGHSVWQVRMYGARAADALGDPGVDALRALAGDSNPNVRGVALRGVVRREGHAADDLLLDALGSDDYGLVRTAADLLEGSPNRQAPAILLATLARLTEAGRDTSRDPRLALLTRLRELGSRRNAGVLRSYLEDPDPHVTAAAAEALTAWTGRPAESRPGRMRAGAPASLDAALSLVGARITMSSGAQVELALFPEEAPASVARFARLAREAYYDGLTFHRVVPNFVIQGGSPGANEFMGDGPYMRDELGLRPHVRGAVGISTRGRDTGDAQIFIDLADNPRLDHNYTAFAQVTRGMDVVDAILEGAVIERVEILEQP